MLVRCEKRCCRFEVGRVEPLGKSVVDRLEERHSVSGTAPTQPGRPRGGAVRTRERVALAGPVCSERSIASSTAYGPSETWLARHETGTNAGDQVVLAERFGEIAIHAGVQSTLTRPFVGKGGDKNGGNGLTGRDQPIMKLNSGHPRHLHVCNHAG